MLSSKRKRTRATGVLSPIARILVVAFTISAAGCSADVTRFDLGSRNSTSSIPVPPEPVRSSYGPSATPRGLGLTEAPLPPAEPPTTIALRAASTTRRPTLRPMPSARRRPGDAGKLSRRGPPVQDAAPCAAARRAPPPQSAAGPNAPFRQPRPKPLAVPSTSSPAKRSTASAVAMAFPSRPSRMPTDCRATPSVPASAWSCPRERWTTARPSARRRLL